MQAAQRGARLTGQMLAFSRNRDVTPQAIDINQVIRESEELLQRTAEALVPHAHIPGKPVLSDGTADFRAKSDAAGSPLAQRLFDIDGVSGVFLGSDFISVTKGETEWQHLKPMILGAIMEHYMSFAPSPSTTAAPDM